MPSQMFMDRQLLWLGGTMEMPTVAGRFYLGGANSFSKQRLPEDSIGVLTLTLTNVVPESVCEIEVTSTGLQTVEPIVAASSTVQFIVPVYGPGDPKNQLRIKVRKGSASPYYQPYETQTAAVVGAQSIFINQLTDE